MFLNEDFGLVIFDTTEKITDIYATVVKLVNEENLNKYNYMALRLFKELNFKWLEFRLLLIDNSVEVANDVLSQIYEIQNSLEFIFLEPGFKMVAKRMKSFFYSIEQSRYADSEQMVLYKDIIHLFDRSDNCLVIDSFIEERILKKDFNYSWANNCSKAEIESIEDLYKHIYKLTYSEHLFSGFKSLLNRDKSFPYSNKELLLIKQLYISYSSIVSEFVVYLLSVYHVPYNNLVDTIAEFFEDITVLQLNSM